MLKFALLALCALSVTFAAPAVNNAAALKAVATSYSAGLLGFKGVIDRLMVKNAAGTTPVQQTAWATQLQKDVIAMHGSFVAANTQLDAENARLTKVVGDLTAQTAALQAQVVAQQKDVAVKQAAVNAAATAVTQNKQKVAQAQANLASADRALRAANEKLTERKDNCFRRRKRDIWKDLMKPFKKIICRSIGAVTGDVRRAENGRNDAQNLRNNVANQLKASNNRLAAARQALKVSQTTLAATQAKVAATSKQRAASQAQQTATVTMEASVKAVIEHLDKVTVGSKKLKEFVADLELLLVSVDAVLIPLNKMSDQLTAQKIAGVTLTKIPTLTAAQKAEVKANLAQLKASLA